ncbi:Phosphatidylinositol 4,5-bisphosphate-binding protein SLM2 [Nakaseomyces bracarensis]|uniref:Phosphatidylinositol 4,5-bisphosphate-binding protein SLM2 n=1 Tax=Nakaseomyces bracarensis TaxID=273131 RepID=A0ABR4NRC1_9SACH
MTNQLDPRSPLVVLVPYDMHPTEQLSQRFTEWRRVIKAVITYLSEVSSVQEELIRQNNKVNNLLIANHGSGVRAGLRSGSGLGGSFTGRLGSNNQDKLVYNPVNKSNGGWLNFGSDDDHTNGTTQVNNFFLPIGNGSIQDVPIILSQFHETMAVDATKAAKELQLEVIPRLETLNKDLIVKIKSIKALSSDFKNNCAKELEVTGNHMSQYVQSIKLARKNVVSKDPYLMKIALDSQIKRQLSEENFLHEAYINLQTSARELEVIIVTNIQNAFRTLAQILGNQSKIIEDQLVSRLLGTFLSVSPSLEWDNFIIRDTINFISLDTPMRRFRDIEYFGKDDPLTTVIQSGYLERRSKYLKSYSNGFYVLTPNFLHEFKTSDRRRDNIPLFSLPLSEIKPVQHSKLKSNGKKDTSTEPVSYKFVLHTKTNGLIHRGHNWVFRTSNSDDMLAWFNNISALCSMGDVKDKVAFIQEKSLGNKNPNHSHAGGVSARSSTNISRSTDVNTRNTNACSVMSRVETNRDTVSTRMNSNGHDKI